MKVLVTGGKGFIGSYVCDNLIGRGHTPVSFDRKGPTDIQGDTRDATAVDQAVYETDAVIHLAGILGTQETVDNPMPTIETNIVGSMNVFQAIRRHDKPAVYITLGNFWMNNPYSITKSTSERFALMANKEWGTKIAIVRGYHAYGPGQKIKPVKKIVPSFVMSALAHEDITVYGDGGQVADMIYVGDLAEILVRALLYPHGVYDSIFEAGTGRATTVKHVAEEVIRLSGSRSQIKHHPMRPGEPEGAVVLADPTTLEPLVFDTDCFMSLEDGLALTIKAYATGE